MPTKNIILYGPPGTGKTYATAARAVALCDGPANIPADRDELMARYGVLVDAGRIQFVTFHQSFSYEDFVEGIRPIIDNEGAGHVRYECRDGIFKQICASAASHNERIAPPATDVDLDVQLWKMSLGRVAVEDDEDVYREAIDKGLISMGWGDPIDFTGCDDGEAIRQKLRAAGRDADAEPYAHAWASVQRFKNALLEGDLVVA